MKEKLQKNIKTHKETIINFFWRFFQIFGKKGIGLLIFIICAKLLTPFEFGIYNYILSIIYMFIIFSDFGISIASSKYVAQFSVSEKEKVKNILFNSSIFIIALSTIVSLLMIAIGKYFFNENMTYIYYVIPLIFLIPLTSLYDGVLRGLKKFKKLSLITSLTGFFSLFYIYIMILKLGLIGALISQTIFYFILLIALGFAYGKINLTFDMKLLKTILLYSSLIGLANMGHFLYTRIDIIILGQFNLIEEISYYEIVNKIFQTLILPVSILATVVAPNTTKKFEKGKFETIRKKVIIELIALFIIGLITAFIVYFISPFLFTKFLPKYQVPLLLQILFIYLFLVPIRFFSTYLNIGYITPTGLVKILTISTFIYGMLNIVLDYIFLNSFGFIGVIYATLISQVLYIITNVTYFFVKTKTISQNQK